MKNQIIKALFWIAVAPGAAWGANIAITPLQQTGLQPGAQVGWGFTLYPDSTDFLVVDSVSLIESNPLGVYTDFFQLYPPFAPGTAAQSFAFDLPTQSGAGTYAIDAGTPLGSLDNIQFIWTYELDPCDLSVTSCTPDQTGLTLLDVNGNVPQVSLLVGGSTSSSAPEPANGWSCLLAVFALAAWQRRMLRNRGLSRIKYV